MGKEVDASEVLRDSHMFPEVSEVLEPQSDTHPALEVSEVLEPQSDIHPASEELEALRGSYPDAEVSEVLESQKDSRPVLEVSEELEAQSDSRPAPEDVVLEAVIRRGLVAYRRDSRESRMAGTVLALEVLAEVKACVCGNKKNPAKS